MGGRGLVLVRLGPLCGRRRGRRLRRDRLGRAATLPRRGSRAAVPLPARALVGARERRLATGLRGTCRVRAVSTTVPEAACPRRRKARREIPPHNGAAAAGRGGRGAGAGPAPPPCDNSAQPQGPAPAPPP